ncbi:MAG: major capsid protein [Pseudomonadota bacterium]
MAILGNTYLDLVEIARRTDKYDNSMAVTELLAQKNPVMQDSLAVACNEGKQHKSTVRTGLPNVAWGRLYKGIPQSKSKTQQVIDTTGFLEGRSTIDQRLLDGLKEPEKMKMVEGDAFLEAMAEEAQNTFFYGSTNTSPEKFDGLATRFSGFSTKEGGQIVDAGGSGSDNMSIWMVEWSDQGCHMLYPSNHPAGLQREDKGIQRVFDEDGNAYYAHEEIFYHHLGLAVKDYRRVVRIANIDVSNLLADPFAIDGGALSLLDVMRKGYHRLHAKQTMDQTFIPAMNQTVSRPKLVIYMNRTAFEAFDECHTEKSNVELRGKEIHGEMVPTYRDIPIRVSDALLNTEAAVA